MDSVREVSLSVEPGEYWIVGVLERPLDAKGAPVVVEPSGFIIEEAEPRVSVARVEGVLEYPVGGVFKVFLDRVPKHYGFVEAVLMGEGFESLKCNWSDNGSMFVGECSVGGFRDSGLEIIGRGRNKDTPSVRVTGRAVLGYRDHRWRLDIGEILVPVRVEETVKGSLLERLKNLFVESGSSERPLVELIREAEEVLEACRIPRVIDKDIGGRCRRLEVLVKSLRDEMEGFLKLPGTVRSLLGKNDPSSLGNALELLNRIFRDCGKPRFRDLEPCKSGESRKLVVEVLRVTAESVESLLDKGSVDVAEKLLELALPLCELEVEGSGASCGRLARLKRLADDISRLLMEGVRVLLPRSSGSERIRARIQVDYGWGRSIIRGLYVDFEPASEYVSVEPEYKVRIPTVQPGSRFVLKNIILRSRLEGRIPVTYKKCYKEYCIETTDYVNVGVTGRAEVEITAFLGNSISKLRSYQPEYIKPVPLPREIEIANYKCTGRLGQGGFAVTLYCEEPGSLVRVAAKIPEEGYRLLLEGRSLDETFSDEEAEDLRRAAKIFDREAKILQELDHPNIIKLVDLGTEPVPYMLFNFCVYGDLRHSVVSKLLRRSSPMDVETAVQLMLPIAHALGYGHKNGVLHLDVKPSNILLDEKLVPLLSDYNIAKIMRTVSRSSRAKGFTPGFAAPEQINNGLGRVSSRSDLFSHAATLYYLVTLRHPYDISEWDPNTGFRSVDLEPVDPRKYNGRVPRYLAEVLATALAVDPLDRFEDMDKYIGALVEVLVELQE